MKKLIWSVGILLIVSISIVYAGKKYFNPRKFMSLKEVCKRYGTKPLNITQFKMAGEDRTIRAKMACSLLKNQKKYIGLDSSEIRQIFGDYSGYYFNESFPTYLINHAEKKGQDVWQILFLIDKEQKISKIVVHKNCCY